MLPKKLNLRNSLLLAILFFCAVALCSSYFFAHKTFGSLAFTADSKSEKYSGPIQHIFFHSLIIYPEKAAADEKNREGYQNSMITATQFKTILQNLYDNNFILINSENLYSFDSKGNIKSNDLYVPKGKKPLIISLDDLSYYTYMKNGGFASKLVLKDGQVKTQVITPEGKTIITSDGDVVPIVDEFVKNHPDFSQNGAKGIIALTGFEGILGYRTEFKGSQSAKERKAVMPVVEALKKSGWIFASHSFTHNQIFLHQTISKEELAKDISRWHNEVEPLVGPTNIFVGPFGVVFKEGDPRRKQLLDAGFKILYGVGIDGYFHFFSDHFVMNRVNIDGLRLTHSPKTLYKMFGIVVK